MEEFILKFENFLSQQSRENIVDDLAVTWAEMMLFKFKCIQRELEDKNLDIND